MIHTPLPLFSKLIYKKRTGSFGKPKELPAIYLGPAPEHGEAQSRIVCFFVDQGSDGKKQLTRRQYNYVRNDALQLASQWFTERNTK